MSQADDADVTHEPTSDRYVIRLGDVQVGLADYVRRGGTWVFTHTEVDPEHSGQGLAGRLVTAAMDHVADQGQPIVALCPYVARWLEDHPDHPVHRLVDDDLAQRLAR